MKFLLAFGKYGRKISTAVKCVELLKYFMKTLLETVKKNKSRHFHVTETETLLYRKLQRAVFENGVMTLSVLFVNWICLGKSSTARKEVGQHKTIRNIQTGYRVSWLIVILADIRKAKRLSVQ